LVEPFDVPRGPSIEAVLSQPAAPPGLPPRWGEAEADYGMDPAVAADPARAAAVATALRSLPSVVVAADPADLFGAERGIYAHPEERGEAWERPASVGWVFPPVAASGVPSRLGLAAGLRIQGHWNRLPDKTPKHSLRLIFKKQYGPGELEARLFAPSDVDRFNTLTLRGGFNDSWLVNVEGQRARAQYIRDEWTRATQRAMGWPASHGTFVHLYLNGLYWGVYNVVERPDDAFAAEHFGGAREDYDVLQHGELVAGRAESWHAMLAIARGGVATPEAYAALEALLDIDSLIDYMLLYLYTGDEDWPKRNWYAISRRAPPSPWRFFAWDGERGLEFADRDKVEVQGGDNPSLPYHHLRIDNPEFRLRFADHVQRHLRGPGGALYVDPANPAWDPEHPERNRPAARFAALAGSVEQAIVAESARWGDYRRPGRPFTLESEWRAERRRLLTELFPARTAVLLDQLRRVGLYPPIEPPAASIEPGAGPDPKLALSATGDIFYTTDGTDPRVPLTGAVAPTAARYERPVPLGRPGIVKARARDGEAWSAMVEHHGDAGDVRVSEIMYHPIDGGDEFIELVNLEDTAVPLYAADGRPWRLAGGVRYAIPYGTIVAPRGRLLIAGGLAPADFRARFGVAPGVTVLGPFAGKLDNAGETVRLLVPRGAGAVPELAGFGEAHDVMDQVSFDDEAPWPPAADGEGASLERVNLSDNRLGADPDDWRAGPEGGTPGR